MPCCCCSRVNDRGGNPERGQTDEKIVSSGMFVEEEGCHTGSGIGLGLASKNCCVGVGMHTHTHTRTQTKVRAFGASCRAADSRGHFLVFPSGVQSL